MTTWIYAKISYDYRSPGSGQACQRIPDYFSSRWSRIWQRKTKDLIFKRVFLAGSCQGFLSLLLSNLSPSYTLPHVPKSIQIPKCNMETKTQQEFTLLSPLVINELVPIPQRESLEALYLLITDLIHVSNSGRQVQMNSVQAQFWALFYGQSCGHNVGMTELFLKIH